MINEYPYHKAPPILKTVYIYAYQARLNRYDYCTTFIAVSYTHLDVYKRQSYCFSISLQK